MLSKVIILAIGFGMGIVFSQKFWLKNKAQVLKETIEIQKKIEEDQAEIQELESLYAMYEYKLDDYGNDIQVLENKIQALRIENQHLRNHVVGFAA